MDDIAVSFQHVWKSYPSYLKITGGIKSFLFNLPTAIKELRARIPVLEDISFEIKRGEAFGFIGRNGAGKSTTLGLIAGVLAPDRGKVTVNGRVSPLLELGAGFHPDLTGRENILLNGVLLGLTKQEIRAMEEEIIEFSGLENFINQPIRIYSSGMHAKLGFSVIAFLKPEILIVDEILSVGDLVFNEKCQKKFEEFRKNGNITIIMVSHSLESVAQICDRVAWVENRKICMLGNASDVVKEYIKVHSQKDVCPVPSISLSSLPAGNHKQPEKDMADIENPKAPALSMKIDARTNKIYFSLYKKQTPANSKLQIFLFQQEPWSLLDSKSLDYEDFTLGESDNGIFIKTSAATLPLAADKSIEPDKPLIFGAQEISEDKASPVIWSPVCLTDKAKSVWQDHQTMLIKRAAGTRLPPFLWPGGDYVRIVARNIVLHDAVGNFAFGMAATLQNMGIPAKLYAYVSSPEYAELVSPISDLFLEMTEKDILYYNFSTEDEFLPAIISHPALKRILYYHNVTPAFWFKESKPEAAACLERAVSQQKLFSIFDYVTANSHFSLHCLDSYINPNVPVAVFPPTMTPDRLAAVEPEAVPIPDNSLMILWVGRLAPHKQPLLAIDIFEKTAQEMPNAILVMVAGGKSDYQKAFMELTDRIEKLPYNTRQRVIILEEISDNRLSWLYKNASLFLCTSGHEGYCLPAAEAASFNVPVATLPQEAILETLNQNAVIISDKPADAASAITEFLKNARQF